MNRNFSKILLFTLSAVELSSAIKVEASSDKETGADSFVAEGFSEFPISIESLPDVVISGTDNRINPPWNKLNDRVATYLYKAFDEAAKYATCRRFWCWDGDYHETEELYKEDFDRFKDEMRRDYAFLPEKHFDDLYDIELWIDILSFGWFKFTDEKVDAWNL